MRYLSVCSGIEAATVAWHDLGWKPVGFSEIEAFPSAVLSHHYPEVTNFGDMTKFKEWNLESINLLVGGTPCQSFSVAGLRKGLKDPRGNLMLTYCGILDYFRPDWFVWENVPGVLSSNGGRDFGSFLGALVELGYGFSYRVLDAQYFGVAQRRRRVFVVGHFGGWKPAAKVLFESESLQRNPAPSREKRKDASVFTPGSIGGYREGFGTLRASGGDIGGGSENLVAKCLTAGSNMRYDADTEDFVIHPFGGMSQVSGTLTANTGGMTRPAGNANEIDFCVPVSYAIQESMIGRSDNAGPQGDGINKEVCFTQNTTDRHAVSTNMAVRRLTPIECERLQGFPDNYTDIKLKDKNTPDSPRYKALGNSMAVPVMKWIGQRIKKVSEEMK